jgi:hypothetical protein
MTQQHSLFSRSLRMFAGHAPLYLVVAAVPYAALLAAAYGLLQWLHWPVNPSMAPTNPADLWNSFTTTTKLEMIAAMLVAMWLPFYLASRGVCRIASAQHTGRAISLGGELRDMAGFAVPALAFSLLIGVLVMIGSIILLVPGVLVPLVFALVVPASAVESLGLFAALGRNFNLLGRVAGRTALVYFLYAAVFVLSYIARAISAITLGQSVAKAFLGTAVWFAILLVPIAIYNICLTLLCHEASQKAAQQNAQTAAAFATSGAGIESRGPAGDIEA